MKSELRSLKTKRLFWGLLSTIVQYIHIWPILILISVFVHPFDNDGISGFSNLLIMGFSAFITEKLVGKPLKTFSTNVFTPRMEEYGISIRKIEDGILATKLKRAEEKEQVIHSKIEITMEMKLLKYSMVNVKIINTISDMVNRLYHDNRTKKQSPDNIIDLTDIEITKKEFKKIKKGVIKFIKKIRPSRMNAVRLKGIEDILTGEHEKKEEEYQKQLEIARVQNQQQIVMLQQPNLTQQPQQIPAQPQLIEQQPTQVIEQVVIEEPTNE